MSELVVEKSLTSAMRAVASGRASPAQQREAFRFVVNVLSGPLEVDKPGLGPHESGYRAGQRYVGIRMLEIAGMKILGIEGEEDDERTGDD